MTKIPYPGELLFHKRAVSMDISAERLQELQAFADGQLSAEQMAEMEANFTPEERLFVQNEQRLVQASRRILGNEDVPAEAWARITAPVRSSSRQSWGWGSRRTFVAAAAMMLCAAGIAWVMFQKPANSFDVFLQHAATETVPELKNKAEILPQPEAIAKALKDESLNASVSGLSMVLMQPKMAGHEVYLLGAHKTKIDGVGCVAVHFQCCGEPVQILMMERNARSDANFARLSNSELGASCHLTERNIGNVQAVFVGKHDGHMLLNVLGN